jgi:hypothetical protein
MGHDFGCALKALHAGRKVRRVGWNGKGMFIGLKEPKQARDMNLPYLYIQPVTDKYVPWTPSQTDILANDWELFPTNNGETK